MIIRYVIKFFKKLSQMNYIISKELKTLTYFAYFAFLFLFILDLVLFKMFLSNMTDFKFFFLFVITLILCYTFFTFKSILSDSTCWYCKFGYIVPIPHKLREKLAKDGISASFIGSSLQLSR
jgi:hypothetical protein